MSKMPIIPILIAVGAFAMFRASKATKGDASKPAGPTHISWSEGSWTIPDGWMSGYATEFLQNYVISMGYADPAKKSGDASEMNPVVIAWAILQGQTGPYMLPPSPFPANNHEWQTTTPSGAGYYSGPEAVLGLLYHMSEHIGNAIALWKNGGDLYLVDSPDE